MSNNLKKSDYTGWQDVFRFSFMQGVKSKSFYVMLIILVLAILVGLPLSAFFQNRKEGVVGDSEIRTLYIYDETGMNMDYGKSLSDERYKNVTVTTGTGSFEEQVKALETDEKSADVALLITFEGNSYFKLKFIKAAKADFSSEDFNEFTADFKAFFDDAKLKAIEVTPEQAAFLDKAIETTVEYTSFSEAGELLITPKEKEEGIALNDYMAFLALIIVVMLIINISGSSIASSIVTEKTTRVIEYLMINVRPMALIIGKILASLLQVVIQMSSLVLAYVVGSKISESLFGALVVEEDSSNMWLGLLNLLGRIQLPELMVVLLVIVFGVLFFSIIAGLAGASVSKLEELAEGMKTYQLTLICGSYVGIGLCIAQLSSGLNPVIIDIFSIIPVTAPFVLPANLIAGQVSIYVGIASVVVLLLATLLMLKFTSQVYESMIFYNGNVLKLRDIIGIARNRKAAKKEVE